MVLLKILFLLLIPFLSAFAQKNLCSDIIIYGGEDIQFSDVEERLLCGDSKLKAYEKIPAYQAKFFIQGFLQSRGYLNPKFDYEGEILHVKVGDKVTVKEIILYPLDLIEGRKIHKELWQFFGGKVITPSLLNAMESALLSLIRQRAYACATLNTKVNGESGVVVFELSQLKRFMFGAVDIEDQNKVHPKAFERFYPFSSDDPFNSKLLELTEKRLIRSGVVQATYFTESCSENALSYRLSQNFIFGPPRVVRFGMGFSSELGPMARARWSHNRFGKMASQVDGNIQASFRSQALTFAMENYLWPDSPRRALLSQFEILRETQEEYQETNMTLKFHPQWSRDHADRFWLWSAGPSLMSGSYQTDEGVGDGQYSAVAIEGGLLTMSHIYELFDYHPEDGSSMEFRFDIRHPSLGFDERLLKLDFSLTALQQLWRWGRGNAVGGIRFNTSTTSVRQQVNLEDLPPSVKYYGGGSNDIRGFPLKTLPENNGLGALSKLLLKLELRKTHLARPSLEGFIFHDSAIFGLQSWSLDPKLYQSPGVGIRWLSPIGLIQAFIAQGYSNNPFTRHGELIYLGLGGDF